MIKWQDIDGWFTEADAEEYNRLLDKVEFGGKMVEVGVYKGRSMASIARKLVERKITYIGVDDFSMCSEYDFLVNMNYFLPKFGATSGLVIEKSWDAPMKVFGNLDLVFIDADHTYDAVKRDINAWITKLKPGGVIAGHDYDGQVKQAVDERFGDKVVKGGHCIWSVQL